MKKLQSLFLLMAVCFFALNASAQGYEIKVKIPQLKNKQIILGHYFAKHDRMVLDDTTMLNKNGVGAFKKKNKLPAGMYFIYLPPKGFIDILLGDNQTFTVENDTTDLIKNKKVIGDKDNQLYIEIDELLTKTGKTKNKLEEEYKTTTDEKRKKEIENQFITIVKTEENKKDELIAANPGLFFSKLLRATQSVKIPDNITDQKEQYYYNRNNYFVNFDYKDARLLRTHFYEARLDFYLDKLVPQAPDSIIPEVDKLIDNSYHNKELFRYMLVHLYSKYLTSQYMGMENVYVHIADKYYIKDAEWASKKDLDEIKENVRRKKQALIGMQAPEVKMILFPKNPGSIEDLRQALTDMKTEGYKVLKDTAMLKLKARQHKASNPKLTDSAAYTQIVISELADKLENIFLPKFDGYVSLTDQKAKYLILYFWEPDCSHCIEATPKFSAAYDEKKLKDKGVGVVAFYLHRNINQWEKYTKHIKDWLDFVEKNNMQKWINVWEPFGYSQFRDKYDISSTPVLYLLDKNKKIIAKHINWDQAIDLIDQIEKSGVN